MPDFKQILFDLDGTLINSAEGITNSVTYALRKMGAPVPSFEELCRFIGPPLYAGFRDFCGFDEAKAIKATEYYREYYRETGIFENTVYDGIPELLTALNRAGKSVILATSKPDVFANRILEHFGLAGYFSFAAGATLDKTRSEKEQVIAFALRRCGITEPHTAVMVGDRRHDIDGAKQNGISSVGVLYGFGNRAELEAAGADYIAEDTQALSHLLLSE